jgi:adenosylcobinamide-GDP ribazoletransferase
VSGVPAARAVLAAVAFLTIVPVGRLVALDGRDVRRSAALFPAVGAGIGAVTGGVAVLLARTVDPLPAAGVAVAAGALLTGGLHLDALADAADGLGGRTAEDALRIMRDHTVGAFGAVALVLDLVIKVAAIASLLSRDAALGGLIAAGGLSRACSAPLAWALPYAQPTPGRGGALEGASAWAAVTAIALGAGVDVAAVRAEAAWAIATALAGALLVAAWPARRVGGVTGDILGATGELCEAAVLVILAAAA